MTFTLTASYAGGNEVANVGTITTMLPDGAGRPHRRRVHVPGRRRRPGRRAAAYWEMDRAPVRALSRPIRRRPGPSPSIVPLSPSPSSPRVQFVGRHRPTDIAGAAIRPRRPPRPGRRGTSGPRHKPVEGVGDPYFPDAGNGGYDVASYDVTVHATIAGADTLDASVTIDATATARLPSCSLDLLGLTVDRSRSTAPEPPQTTRVTSSSSLPPRRSRKGHRFTIVVAYHGTRPATDGPTAYLDQGGWVDLAGYSAVIGEPVGAATWLPCNDHPSDKATIKVTATVPDPARGDQQRRPPSRSDAGGSTTFVRQAAEPMATYLMTLAIGDYDLVDGTATTPSGPVPIINGFPVGEPAQERSTFDRFAEIIEFSGRAVRPRTRSVVRGKHRRYPASSRSHSNARRGRCTRPTCSAAARRRTSVVAHELAHQWFGDAVTPGTGATSG